MLRACSDGGIVCGSRKENKNKSLKPGLRQCIQSPMQERCKREKTRDKRNPGIMRKMCQEQMQSAGIVKRTQLTAVTDKMETSTKCLLCRGINRQMTNNTGTPLPGNHFLERVMYDRKVDNVRVCWRPAMGKKGNAVPARMLLEIGMVEICVFEVGRLVGSVTPGSGRRGR